MAEAQVSEGKIREALKFLEAEHKENELRKTVLSSYLNLKEGNRALEKERDALTKELSRLHDAIDEAKKQHAKDTEAMQKEFYELKAKHDTDHASERDAAQKELAGLKASVAKTRKQVADVEKEAAEKIAAANEKVADRLKAAQETCADLDRAIQEKTDRIARLDEEFRTFAQKHGFGAAAVNE